MMRECSRAISNAVSGNSSGITPKPPKETLLWKKILAELIFIAAPLVFSAGLYHLIPNIPRNPNALIIGSIGGLFLILALLFNVSDKALLVFRSSFIGLLFLFWLKETAFGFEGFAGDSRYIVHSIQRFYYSFLPYSHEYKNVHFSYPPLYYFLVGRIGALFRIDLPSLLKYSSYLFVVYLPYLWGYMMKGIFKEKRWHAAFILSLLIPFKTYFTWYGAISGLSQKGPHLIGTFLIIIWYVWVKKKNPSFWKAGLAGGIVFAFHYYSFFFVIPAVIIELGMQLARKEGLKKTFQSFLYWLKTACVVVAANGIWLAPFFADLAKYAWGTSFSEWFRSTCGDVINVFGFFSNFDVFSIAFMAALIYLFSGLTKPEDMDSLRLLFYSATVLLALLYLQIFFFHTPLSLNNYSLFLSHVLAFAFVFLMIRLGRKISLPVLILLVLASTSVLNQLDLNEYVCQQSIASSRRYERSADFREAYDLKNEIIFPHTNELFFGKNTYSFISPVIMYSDIAGSYERRLGYLKNCVQLLKSSYPSEFHRKLKNSPFGPVNFLVFRKDGETLFFDLEIYLNILKHADKNDHRAYFRFSPARLDTDYFEIIYTDDEFVVYKLK